jgi:serine/threonine protein kinase
VIDDNYHVKLIDFGSAAVEPRGNPNYLWDRFMGTVQFAAPEILRGEKFRGRPADVWALGVLLYTVGLTLVVVKPLYERINTHTHVHVDTSRRESVFGLGARDPGHPQETAQHPIQPRKRAPPGGSLAQRLATETDRRPDYAASVASRRGT